jgi:predicted nucleotide-binding protein
MNDSLNLKKSIKHSRKNSKKVYPNSNNLNVVFENNLVDFKDLRIDVQEQINQNKINGLPKFHGVSKVFVVELVNATAKKDFQKILNNWKKEEHFLRIEIVEKNRIRIVTKCDFYSEKFDEIMLPLRVEYELLQEIYELDKI